MKAQSVRDDVMITLWSIVSTKDAWVALTLALVWAADLYVGVAFDLAALTFFAGCISLPILCFIQATEDKIRRAIHNRSWQEPDWVTERHNAKYRWVVDDFGSHQLVSRTPYKPYETKFYYPPKLTYWTEVDEARERARNY